jgi:hypothetical protein
LTQILADICYDHHTGKGCPAKLQAALSLTPYQIRSILNAERDKDGKLRIWPTPQAPSLTPEEKFTWHWVMRCLPRWLIAKLWREKNGAA